MWFFFFFQMQHGPTPHLHPVPCLPTDAVSCASSQPISEYHQHLTAPPPTPYRTFFFSLRHRTKETLIPPFSGYTLQTQPQMTSQCCSAALSMKGVSRFLWYKEFVHWPLGSAVLQTSWRDSVYSFISGCYYADGRLRGEQGRISTAARSAGRSEISCHIPSGQTSTALLCWRSGQTNSGMKTNCSHGYA